MKAGFEFLPAMIVVMILAFIGVFFFMGMLIHSSLMYEDKKNLKRNSEKAWILSMTVGTGITGWMFIYGYYMNFF